ncbi:MAG TPA: C40 family peptidase [Pseudonocardiaceae bacterium]|nr:C40 family peptidase [Pseudonocardiaceae bacterium]
MTMFAAATVASRGKRTKGRLLGCVLLLASLMVIALMLVAVLDDDSASATGINGVDCAPIGTTAATGVAGYAGDQMTNAATIVAVGRQMNVPEQGRIVAIAAAMQESGLHNLDHGDRDSLGLFQERPSQGWGTPAQIMNPTYAAMQFYRRLLAVSGWRAMSVNDAAQAVERSGFPDAYATHEQAAREVVGAVQGVACAPSGDGGPRPSNPKADMVINAALSQLGVPYAWDGGTSAGPSPGTGVDAGKVGFDCSGLALYAYAKIGVAVPHQTQAIWSAFQPAITDPADVQPGDLILLSNNQQQSGIHHVAIYLDSANGGRAIEAPDSGGVVQITNEVWTSPYWTHQFIGAVRPGVA